MLLKSVNGHHSEMPYLLSSCSRRLIRWSGLVPEVDLVLLAFGSTKDSMGGSGTCFWAINLASFLAATRLGLRNANTCANKQELEFNASRFARRD
jgi:hypothetical protein